MKLIKVDGYWIIVNNKADEGINPEVKFFDDKVDKNGFYISTEFLTEKKQLKLVRGIENNNRFVYTVFYSQNPEHNLPSITFSDEVAEELGIVNIATKGIIASEEFDDNHQCQNDFAFGFYSGYNQALSDNKDKLFTLEQMESCFFNGGGFKTLEEFNFYIQSITKKQYDCELEMYEPIKNSPSEVDRFINITYNSVKVIKLMK